jgi:hypothetical protein
MDECAGVDRTDIGFELYEPEGFIGPSEKLNSVLKKIGEILGGLPDISKLYNKDSALVYFRDIMEEGEEGRRYKGSTESIYVDSKKSLIAARKGIFTDEQIKIIKEKMNYKVNIVEEVF